MNKDHVPMRDRPVIITGPGTYTCRAGYKVVIVSVSTSKLITFGCKGHVIKPPPKPGGRSVRIYQIWHESGAYKSVGAHAWDVVAKEEETV